MAIALDATSGNNTVDGTVHTSSRAHTVGSGLSNSALFVLVSCRRATTEGGMPVSGITFAGSNLTLAKAQIGTDVINSRLNTEVWYLLNPPAGLGTYTVTYTGTVSFSTCYGVSLSGVNQITPTGITAGSARDGATDASPHQVILNSVQTDSWVVNAYYNKIGNDITVGQGTAVGTSGPSANGDRSGGAYQGPLTATTGTASWTFTGSDGWTMAAVEVLPFVAATTGRMAPITLMKVGN